MSVLIGRHARSIAIAAVASAIIINRYRRNVDRTRRAVIAITIVIIGVRIGGGGSCDPQAHDAGNGGRTWIEAATTGTDVGHATGGSSEALAGRGGPSHG